MKFRQTFFQEHSPESPDEQYVMDSARMVRTFDVFFNSPGAGARLPVSLAVRRQAVEDFLGANAAKTVGSYRYITRQTPYGVPAVNTSFLLANGGGARPFYATAIPTSHMLQVAVNDASASFLGQAGGVPAGPFWRCKVLMDSVPWQVLEDASVLPQAPPAGGTASPLLGGPYPDEGDCLRRGIDNTRYIVRYLDFGGRVVTLNQGVMYTVDPGDTTPARPVSVGVPLGESCCLVHYLWKAVPAAGRPLKAIQALLAPTCNEVAFDGWDEGCLSLQSVKEKLYQGPLGDTLYDMDYAFKFLPHRRRKDGVYLGWNSILHRLFDGTIDYGFMDSFSDGTTNHPPYVYADYCALFRPDQP